MAEERAQECLDWLSTPGTALELWAWRKVKAQRGGKLLIWQPRVQILTVEELLGGRQIDTVPAIEIPGNVDIAIKNNIAARLNFETTIFEITLPPMLL